jgi:hypothetical protein
MPTVTEKPVQVYAHCGVPTCPGATQAPVEGFEVVTSFSFVDRGGDIPGEEQSNVQFRFAEPAEAACPSCGRARHITDQAKISYQPLSGFDPMGLLEAEAFDPGKRNTIADEQVAELEAKNRALEAKLDKLIEKLG